MAMLSDTTLQLQTDEDRARLNAWIHATILRRPIYCDGTFQAFREIGFDDEGETPGLLIYRCPRCRRECAVSRFARAYASALLPDRHEIPLPDYAQNDLVARQLMQRVIERDEIDPLRQQFVMALLAKEERAELVGEAPVMPERTWSAEQICRALHAGHQAAHTALKAEYPERHRHWLDRLPRLCHKNGIPLFARIGPPQASYAARDLPYMQSYPSERWYYLELLCFELPHHFDWRAQLTPGQFVTLEEIEHLFREASFCEQLSSPEIIYAGRDGRCYLGFRGALRG